MKQLNDISDVIWLQTSFIGDVVLTTSAMASLAKVAPGVKQHLITTKAGAQALDNHPLLNSTHVFSKREGLVSPILNVRKSIKDLNLRSPVILQPHKSLRSTILARLLGYPTITYRETSFSWTADVTVPRVAVFHEADRIAILLEGLGLSRKDFLGRRPFMPQKDLPDYAMAILNKNLKWIGVAPGSVWATKRWPSAKYANLVTQLLQKSDYGIILLGGPEDQTACSFIEASSLTSTPAAATRLLNLAGKTNLKDLPAIYAHLQCLISNDSSPIHYASAFNIPTLAIFGATVPSMGFAPLADKRVVAQTELSCRPCGVHGHQKCPLDHFKCMNDLSVETVLGKIHQLISL
jgi:heptosyltransferase-2